MTSNFLFGGSAGMVLLQRILVRVLYQDRRGPGSNPDKPEFFQALFSQLSLNCMLFFNCDDLLYISRFIRLGFFIKRKKDLFTYDTVLYLLTK